MNSRKSTKLVLAIIGIAAPLFLIGNYTGYSKSDLEPQQVANNKTFKLVVIDPGHGGKLPGAYGKNSAEKDIVLQVSLKLKEAIEKELPGVKAILTRESDIDVPFHERSNIANRNHADLFISIHCNSANSDQRVKGKNGRYSTRTIYRPGVSGTETFVCGYNRLQRGESDVAMRENADILMEENYQENYNGFDPNDPSSYIIFSLLKRTYREKSIKFASYVQNEYVGKGRLDRGVQELSLAVLAGASMPAVLTEIGFISNPDEESYMLSEVGQAEIVKNLVDAIRRYKQGNEAIAQQ
ncbi:N-acetylmuramoyl-L-alanine amidase [Sphingobacterium sp. DK4209]|uniref:N-acetylmuramoyl-L-alanine amidase n=1 Tax=Sphingobacterium zhuxiongii TaxID=2662364 RepID=A0A5Q0Q8G9_9SPHI|nr:MULTISPECIES: N-acetylmuramoyl-L-alanine amidase [unclassified Sphingobacterium]MVZ66913.1 N-acetylmuramoyl-L-alanine amidase [Sphingobacterium sp. DK4209]QGA25554.1 N-acetylmuramoyl-L-alanine amidase [Sphingobacterium sp. dk4302]